MDALSLAQFAMFVSVLAVAILSPGPSIIAASQSAISRGGRASLPYALGLAVGASLWCLAALFGLNILFTLVPQLFVGFKILGGIYLLWIGWKIWRHAADPLALADPGAGPGFWSGIALNLSNPKPALFYSAVLLSVFPALHGFTGPAVVYLVALSVELTFYVTVTLLMSAGPVRRRYFGAKLWIDRIAGGLISMLGLSLVIRH